MLKRELQASETLSVADLFGISSLYEVITLERLADMLNVAQSVHVLVDVPAHIVLDFIDNDGCRVITMQGNSGDRVFMIRLEHTELMQIKPFVADAPSL